MSALQVVDRLTPVPTLGTTERFEVPADGLD